MDEVLRQDDERFLSFLDNLRQGTVSDDDVEFFYDHCLDRMEEEKRQEFLSDAIHLVPRWNMSHTIVYEYLSSFNTPLAKVRAKLTCPRNNGINHCVKESSMPILNAFCIDCHVMLVRNFIVDDYKIMNGAIGIVKDIVYKESDGPHHTDGELPASVIVDFPQTCIPQEKGLIPGQNSTWIPIPVVTERCERQCCSISTIPLIVCKAITIHKSQGMTIGPHQQFEKVIVHLPTSTTRKSPGIELVACSRAMNPDCIAFGNKSSDLTTMELKKIGTTNSYDLRRSFETEMKRRADESQTQTIEAITALDNNHENKTYEGGCKFLLSWFRNETRHQNNDINN